MMEPPADDFDMEGIVLFMLLDLAILQAELLGGSGIRITREMYEEASKRRNSAGIGMHSTGNDEILISFVQPGDVLPNGHTGTADCPACAAARNDRRN